MTVTAPMPERNLNLVVPLPHEGTAMRTTDIAAPALASLRTRLQAVAHEAKVGAVFPNRKGNPYTASGFAAMWGKLMREAMAKKVIERRFTFHDLRAHYTTEHKTRLGTLPDMHASPTTTARVYERSRVSKRQSL